MHSRAIIVGHGVRTLHARRYCIVNQLAVADKPSMDPKRLSVEAVFRKYTRVGSDRKCLIVDVRPQKEFKRRHLLLSYCVRLTSNGKALVDYSKNLYDLKWSQVCVSVAD
jgi:hypothetical protein